MSNQNRFCSRCGKRAPRPGRKSCEPCAEAFRKYDREKKLRIPAGTCSKCGNAETLPGYKRCQACRAVQAANMVAWRQKRGDKHREYQRGFFRKRRELTLAHYGGSCACCGEAKFEFLALDHIEGGGDAHRRAVGSGSNTIEWLIRNDFPEGFRVLCHNCNQARGYYGYCPHDGSAVGGGLI